MSAKTDYHSVSQKVIADIHGVDVRTIRRWQEEEWFPRKEDGTFDAPATIAARMAHESGVTLDLNAEKARLAKWQADRVEMDVAVRAGELGVISEVADWYGNHIERCRSRLIQISDAIGQFCDPRTATIVVGEARRLIYEALAELAAERPKGPQADSGEVDAAADSDRERMGGREPETVERV